MLISETTTLLFYRVNYVITDAHPSKYILFK